MSDFLKKPTQPTAQILYYNYFFEPEKVLNLSKTANLYGLEPIPAAWPLDIDFLKKGGFLGCQSPILCLSLSLLLTFFFIKEQNISTATIERK